MNYDSNRIVILQSCDEAYAPMLEATAAANSAYARRHGYDYRPLVDNLSPIPCTGNFNRYYLLREEIDGAVHDWALWLDADAIVIDHQQDLDSFIGRSPDKLVIACRGSCQGDHDINNGVFLLNLRHSLARPLVERCIQYVECLNPSNSRFRNDQWLMQAWLREQQDASGRVPIVRCYTGSEYNLLNYDGPFIRHVLREFGDFQARVRELQRLARRTNSACIASRRTVAAPEHASPSSATRVVGTPSAFQRQERILVAAPAAYREPPASSRWLLESCRRYGIELTLLGVGQRYANHMRKISLVAEYLRDHPEYRYVLQLDFKDVVCCATLREMFTKYKDLGRSILAAGERISWPVPSHNWLSPVLGASPRYLNAGTIFATTEGWLAAWEQMERKARVLKGKAPEQSPGGHHIFNCDQAAWSEMYIKGEADIGIDSRCELFQVLNKTDWSIAAANRDFIFEGRRIINRETGSRPCLIHANANLPLEPWAKYILNPAAVWIWPLIDRIRNADRQSLRDSVFVERLLLDLGLHHPIDGYVPDSLLPYTGKGLLIWQRPTEFAQYLVWLSQRPPIHSYLEIGVESGGSFIATIEYLRRFHPLRVAIGVDPVLYPPVLEYVSRSEDVHFIRGTQESGELRWLMAELNGVDLTFIDGDHSAKGVRADWEFVRSQSRFVVFHDIAAENLPGVKSLWNEIRSTHPITWEFVDSYFRPNFWAGIGAVERAPSVQGCSESPQPSGISG